jgi:hypothetical protein
MTKQPKWYLKRVSYLDHDQDGWWLGLKDGWQDRYNPGCHTINENSKREVIAIARDAIVCDCPDCWERLGQSWRALS